MRSLKIAALVALFLAAISAIIPNAFFLIGLDLITRDRLADFWGTTRWFKMILLIAAGGLLSYWLNRHAATIAEASVIAFSAAEACEAIVYHLLRRQRWVERAPKAALMGAAVDSVLFPTIAFGGFVFATSFGQFAAKLAGGLVWTWVIATLMPPPSMAPAVSMEA
jgi:hypothetical protein